MKKTVYNPGDIVKLGGIEFVVLDNNMAGSSSEEEILFILALESQGQSRFGKNSNNYANEKLRDAVCDWLDILADSGVDVDTIKPRILDLTTVDGYRGYGSIEVKAAPLTMDEARKYAEVIPNCDEATWLSTGWGGPERFGSANALGVYADGNWYNGYCARPHGVRPALVILSSLLDSEGNENGLEKVSTEALLEELRRRTKSEQ